MATDTVFPLAQMGKVSGKMPKSGRFGLRPLQRSDYGKGFASLLAQLTDIEGLSQGDFEKQFDNLRKNGNYFVVVVEDLEEKKIVATATLFVEEKFVHKNGKVGHIEDVVVDGAYRKHNFGLIVIDQLKQIGWSRGVYKIILDCADNNVGFYQRCGFSTKETQMALYKSKL